MTNEEAIKLIDDRMCFGRGKWSEHHRPVIDEYWQAGEMAIKALTPIQPDNNSEKPNSSDTISRQAAIDDIWTVSPLARLDRKWVDRWLRQLPSAQPEIIRCRECKFASGDSRICMKFDHSPIGELDFCSFAERREVTT